MLQLYFITTYLAKYNDDIQKLFTDLRGMVIQSVDCDLEEKLWAKLPSYYLDDKFIRLIPFKDHVNIEAKSVMKYSEQLHEYKITPKGMLQIYLKQDIPKDVLSRVFSDTLMN